MILNLTEHRATQEQKEEGVVDLPEPEREKLIELLTFNTIPVPYTLRTRALAITTLALNTGAEMAMIGGAPYLMSHLERELAYVGISAMYSINRAKSASSSVLPIFPR